MSSRFGSGTLLAVSLRYCNQSHCNVLSMLGFCQTSGWEVALGSWSTWQSSWSMSWVLQLWWTSRLNLTLFKIPGAATATQNPWAPKSSWNCIRKKVLPMSGCQLQTWALKVMLMSLLQLININKHFELLICHFHYSWAGRSSVYILHENIVGTQGIVCAVFNKLLIFSCRQRGDLKYFVSGSIMCVRV